MYNTVFYISYKHKHDDTERRVAPQLAVVTAEPERRNGERYGGRNKVPSIFTL